MILINFQKYPKWQHYYYTQCNDRKLRLRDRVWFNKSILLHHLTTAQLYLHFRASLFTSWESKVSPVSFPTHCCHGDESWGPLMEARSHREEAVPGEGDSGRWGAGEEALWSSTSPRGAPAGPQPPSLRFHSFYTGNGDGYVKVGAPVGHFPNSHLPLWYQAHQAKLAILMPS